MKISQLTALVDPLQPAADLLPIIDFSDKSMGSTGTNKRITITQLFTDPTVTGTLTSFNNEASSLTEGALWLRGGKGAIVLDNGGHKRIAWNDGINAAPANLSIRSGNYFNGTDDVYAVESGTGTTGGAAKIVMMSDGSATDGSIEFSVAPNGIAGNAISYSNSVKVWKDKFTIGSNVGIGTTTPGAKLNVVDNSTSDAVRITQTGTGNAFVVEDETSPDATPLAISSDGRLIVGHTAAIAGSAGVNSYIQAHGTTSNATSSAGLYDWQNVAIAGPIFNFNKSKSATVGVRGAVASGDRLGTLVFGGDDGTNFITAASINCLVDGATGTNDMPGRLTFSTTADGASTPTERMRITNNGTVFIGNGPTSGTPNAATLSATGGSGANAAGASLTIRGGASTGDVTGGSIILSTASAGTAGSTVNAAVQRACITGSGYTLFGPSTNAFTTRSASTSVIPDVQIVSDSSSSLVARFSDDTTGPRQFFSKSHSATVGTHAEVVVGSELGTLSFGGSDSQKIVEAARIQVEVEDGQTIASTNLTAGRKYRITNLGTGVNWTAVGAASATVGVIFVATGPTTAGSNGTATQVPYTGHVPGRIVFSTTPVNASTPVERMRIDREGRVGIGTGTTTVENSCILKLESSSRGFRPPAMTDAQRNLIASPIAGLMIYNTDQNAIQFHNGTAWQQLSFTAAP